MLSSLTRHARPLRAVALAAAAFAALSAESCGTDDNDDSAVTGTYALTGVATASAPIYLNPAGTTFSCGNGQTCEFQNGSITLNSSGNFSLSVQGLQRASGGAAGTGSQVSFVTSALQTGTWSQNGSTITFTPSVSSLGTFTGQLSDGNNQLVVSNIAVTGGGTYNLRFEQ